MNWKDSPGSKTRDQIRDDLTFYERGRADMLEEVVDALRAEKENHRGTAVVTYEQVASWIHARFKGNNG